MPENAGGWGATGPHSNASRPSDRDLGGLALGLGGNAGWGEIFFV
ncbi:MAG: hypothetical protein ACHBN1_16405 [Heteroscytonema crispum UTEX LB 1556]